MLVARSLVDGLCAMVSNYSRCPARLPASVLLRHNKIRCRGELYQSHLEKKAFTMQIVIYKILLV